MNKEERLELLKDLKEIAQSQHFACQNDSDYPMEVDKMELSTAKEIIEKLTGQPPLKEEDGRS